MYNQHLWLRLKCLFVLNNDLNTSKIIQGYIQRYCRVINLLMQTRFFKKKKTPLYPKCADLLLKTARSTYWLFSKHNLCVSYIYVRFVICHKSTLHMSKNKFSVVSRPKVDMNRHLLFVNQVQSFPVSHINYGNRRSIFPKRSST